MTVITCAFTPAKVDPQARTITGTATFFGQRANASTGPVIFEPGSLILPDDLSRVKLCIEHDHHSAVGYGVAAAEEGDRLTMRFFVPETPAGDEALASAANGLRDGLSVGAYPEPGGWQYVNGEETTHITRATIREVSLTAIPAFPDARVTNVAAALDPKEKETPMK
ncbi:HK97 family phage prohead protease, partial [Schaalia hyovaginalis]